MTKRKSVKLVKLSVRWAKHWLKGFDWTVERHRLEGISDTRVFRSKSVAIHSARLWQRDIWRNEDLGSELTIYNKNGRIARGGTARTTYPRSLDPKVSKG